MNDLLKFALVAGVMVLGPGYLSFVVYCVSRAYFCAKWKSFEEYVENRKKNRGAKKDG